MSIKHDITIAVTRNGAQIASAAFSREEEGEVNRDLSIAANTTDHPLALALTLATVRSLVVVADKDCTVRTNSTATPQETLELKANVPIVWHDDMPGFTLSDLFAGDLTDVYVTTGADATAFKWYTVVNV